VLRPRVYNMGYEFHDPHARGILIDAMEQVIEVEAPMSQEMLLTRVREAWRLGRAGARVRDAFVDALAQLRKERKVRVDRYGFIWRPDQQLTRARFQSTDPDSVRSQGHLTWEELGFAVLNLVRDAHSVSWEELTVAVARFFGWARRGPEIGPAIDASVRQLINSGQLMRHGDRLTATD
jgi:hypothetical protein